jgi:iron(III) transport system permease protein
MILILCLAATAAPLLALVLAGALGMVGLWSCSADCAWLPAFMQPLLANAQSLSLGAVLGAAVWDSAVLSACVVGMALLLGTALAWLTSQYQFAGRRLFEVLLITPMALPAYVAAYAWVELLAYEAPLASGLRAAGLLERLPDIRNTAGAALVLALGLMPYIYSLARLAFAQQGARLGEVAASLGVARGVALRRIYLPLAWPALAAGGSLVLMESLADYGVAAYMGVNTLTVTVYKTWFAGEQKLTAIAMVLCLLAACASLLRLERRWRGQAAKFQAPASRRTAQRQPLHGAAAAAAVGCHPAGHIAVAVAARGDACKCSAAAARHLAQCAACHAGRGLCAGAGGGGAVGAAPAPPAVVRGGRLGRLDAGQSTGLCHPRRGHRAGNLVARRRAGQSRGGLAGH